MDLSVRWFRRAAWISLAVFAGVIAVVEPHGWTVVAALLLGALGAAAWARWPEYFRLVPKPSVTARERVVGGLLSLLGGVGGMLLVRQLGAVTTVLLVLGAFGLSAHWLAPAKRLLGRLGLGPDRTGLEGTATRDPGPAAASVDAEGGTAIRLPTPFFVGLAIGFLIGLILLPVVIHLSLRPPTHTHRPASIGTELRPPPLRATESVSGLEWELRDLDGGEAPLSAFEGKVLFVNRWATWCPPCIVEMPAIGRLIQQVPSEDMAYLLVSDEPLDVVREFVGEQGWQLPVYVYAGDEPAPFRSSSIPATFIVDREGHIAFRHVGAVAWDDPLTVGFLTNLLED